MNKIHQVLRSTQPSHRAADLPLGRTVSLALGALGVALLAACSSVPEPREEIAVGKAAVDRVSGPSGAESALEVAAARDKISRANTALTNKDYPLARRLAQEAEADAALAEAKARATRSESALAEVRASLQALRRQMAGS